MAQLNPSPPATPDPNYLGFSKVPEPNVAIEKLLEGVGNLFNTGVQGADLIVKKSIDDELYGRMSSEQIGHAGALEVAKAAAKKSKGGIVPGVPTPDTPTMDDGTEIDEENLPSEFSSQMKTIQNLNEASKRGLNQTYYASRLNAISSDLKQRMPGYSSYIDEKVRGIIGGTADLYIRNLVQDLQDYNSSARKQQDQLINFIKSKSELPGAGEMMMKAVSGQIDLPSAVSWASRWESDKFMQDKRRRDREEFTGNLTVLKERASRDFNVEMASTSDNLFQNVMQNSGIKNPEELRQLVLDVQSGKRPAPSTEEAMQLAQQLQAFRSQAFNMLRQRAYEGGDKSYVAQMGAKPNEVNDMINSHLVMYDDLAKAISTKNYALAGLTAEKMNQIVEDTKNNIINNPSAEIRTYGRQAQAIKDLFGERYAAELFKLMLGQDLDPKFRKYVLDEQRKILTQDDVRTKGLPPRSLKQSVETIRQNVTQKEGPVSAADPRLYKNVIDMVNLISNPEVPDKAKLTLMQGAFSTNNNGFLSLFQKDGVDPATGKPILGMYSTFKQMAAPAITKEVMRLNQTNPGTAEMYMNWLDHAFSKELFGREIKDLNNLQQFKNINVQYDPDLGRFFVRELPKMGVAGTPAERAAERTAAPYQNRGLASAQQMLDRINEGISVMSPAIKAAGGDPEAYILQLMMGMGYKPKDGADGTVPELFMRTLINQRVRNAVKSGQTEQTPPVQPTE